MAGVSEQSQPTGAKSRNCGPECRGLAGASADQRPAVGQAIQGRGAGGARAWSSGGLQRAHGRGVAVGSAAAAGRGGTVRTSSRLALGGWAIPVGDSLAPAAPTRRAADSAVALRARPHGGPSGVTDPGMDGSGEAQRESGWRREVSRRGRVKRGSIWRVVIWTETGADSSLNVWSEVAPLGAESDELEAWLRTGPAASVRGATMGRTLVARRPSGASAAKQGVGAPERRAQRHR